MFHKFLKLGATVLLALVFVSLLILLLNLSESVKATSSVLYVAPNADCGSGNTPCYGNIQAAVDSAIAGDEIRVAMGTYTEVNVRPRQDLVTTGVVTQIVYLEKTVTICGGYTTTNWVNAFPITQPTILDAQSRGRVLYIVGEISPTIKGLQLTNGDAVDGGGIYIYRASVSLLNNKIYSNTATRNGGGIDHYEGGGTFSNNIIHSNSANEGGGIRLGRSTAVVNNNTITNNQSGTGGGIEINGGSPRLNGNTIRGNSARFEGGGARIRNSKTQLNGDVFIENTAVFFGGGLSLDNNTAIFSATRVLSNTARNFMGSSGGGISAFYDRSSFFNSVIANNRVEAYASYPARGGGVDVRSNSSLKFYHLTLARNTSSDLTGLRVDSGSVQVINAIIVNHGIGISVTNGATVTVNGVLWHETPITVQQGTTATVEIYQEVSGNPFFAPDGYHLTNASSAINQGVFSNVINDVDGQPRPIGGYDLGADEVMPNVTVDQTTGATLIYTDAQGTTTEIQVPVGAVNDSTTLVYEPVIDLAAPTGFVFAGHAFDLKGYRNDVLVPTVTFNVPVTIVLHYTDFDVVGIDEEKLMLRTLDDGATNWVNAACGAYDRHLAENWLAVPICHLSRFALFAEKVEYKVYLPLILRNP